MSCEGVLVVTCVSCGGVLAVMCVVCEVVPVVTSVLVYVLGNQPHWFPRNFLPSHQPTVRKKTMN